MNLIEHAETELRRAGYFDTDSDYNGMLGPAVMRLIHCHAAERHSGYSSAMVLHLFNLVANHEALTSLTDSPAEWADTAHLGGGPLWQNRRQPSCFSRDGGKTWYNVDEKLPVHTSRPTASSRNGQST